MKQKSVNLLDTVWKQQWLTRRQRLAVVSGVMGVMMWLSLWFSWPLWSIVGLLALAYVGFAYGIRGDLQGREWLIVPLPLLMGVVAGFGWLRLYLGETWLLLLGSVAFAVAMYGLMLTLNIMSVAAARSVPLQRTASSVLSLSTFLIGFILYYLILYFQPSFLGWLLQIGSVTLILAWPVLWMSMPGKSRGWRSVAWSSLVTLVIVELAAVLALWPRSFMTSVFLAACLYIGLGIVHYQEQRRVNRSMQRQYLALFVSLMVVLYLVTRWYGA